MRCTVPAPTQGYPLVHILEEQTGSGQSGQTEQQVHESFQGHGLGVVPGDERAPLAVTPADAFSPYLSGMVHSFGHAQSKGSVSTQTIKSDPFLIQNVEMLRASVKL